MTDIVRRLREELNTVHAHLRHRSDVNTQLRAEIARLETVVVRGLAGVELSEENDRLIAEIERLQAEREANVAGLIEYENQTIDLMVENERLRNNEKAQLEGAAALLIADQNLLNEIERLRTRIEQLEERGNMADN